MNAGIQAANAAWRADLDRRLTAHRARQAQRCPELRPVTMTVPIAVSVPAPAIAPILAPIALPAEPLAGPVMEPPRRTAAAAPPDSWSGVVAAPVRSATPMLPIMPALPLGSAAELAGPAWVPPRRMSAPPLPRALNPDSVLRIALPMAAPRLSSTSAVPARLAVASCRLRLAAGMTDAVVVGAASLCFAAAAWAVSGFAAPDAHSLRHFLPALAAVPLLLTGLYRFACAAGGTASIGMQRHGLELAGFDGPVTQRARRRRAWFGLLSLAALGAGYGWMFLDQDRLTWHDTISRTYPRRRFQ